jgi:hypothetical protein
MHCDRAVLNGDADRPFGDCRRTQKHEIGVALVLVHHHTGFLSRGVEEGVRLAGDHVRLRSHR